MESPSLQNRVVKIIDARTEIRCVVDAILISDFPIDRIPGVEDRWGPVRQQLGDLAEAELEHAHWDWRRKTEVGYASRHRIIAIEYEDDIQGLMSIENTGRSSRISPSEEVLYVDYIESAPWNLRELCSQPCFLAIGTSLMMVAILISKEMGFNGRVGLHSLSQSLGFYQQRCGMTSLGQDRLYHSLEYFEYNLEQAQTWLEAMGA